jgi:hypothetical protein
MYDVSKVIRAPPAAQQNYAVKPIFPYGKPAKDFSFRHSAKIRRNKFPKPRQTTLTKNCR